MLRRLGIRAKVLAVLAVPMIVLLIAGAYISFAAFDEARSARAATEVIDVLNAYAPFGSSLQAERTLSLSTYGTDERLAEQRRVTDEALAALRPVTARVDVTKFPVEVVAMFAESQTAHNVVLPATRELVDTDGQTAIIRRNYDAIITGQIELVGQIQESLENRDLAAYVAALETLSQTEESLGQELTQGLTIIETQATSTSALREFATQSVSTEVYRNALRIDIATLGDVDVALEAGDPTSEFTRQRAVLVGGIPVSVAASDPEAWAASIESQLANLDEARIAMLANAVEAAQAAEDADRTTAYVTIAISLLAAVLSALFALVVSRAITIPLKRLTAAAAEVREQLPKLVEQVAVPGQSPDLQLAQIPVESSDEIGRLAAAFNSVNSTTLQVAQDQAALRGSIAEMFINVARRDQVLLNRQLSFIDSLERSEEDPNALANLFRLDHLATRMRRNAESLLVLAGIDTGRRVRDSMPLSDVIRTASSEIEQYDRIELDLAVDPQMLGFNALGAAHLLAELFENATIFSEPETPVEVTTGAYGGHVVVQVLDHGLGMSEAEIEAANIKIRSTAAGDALGAQRLGLFVVGRIANRLGAEVTLAKSSRGTGTVTQVRFPITMFETTESALYGAPSAQAPQLLSSARRAGDDAPLVEAVDLAQLTDGATSLGLPRRRLRGDEGEVDGAVPASTGLPQRGGRTFDESKIVLPGLAEATLAPELASDNSGWTPAVAAAPSNGLPSRSRSASPIPLLPGDDDAAEAVPAAAPEARTALFSGFRTRADLPTPAPAESDVPPHPRRSAFGDMEIPGLAPDDDEVPGALAPAWSPADVGPTTSDAAAVVSDELPDQPVFHPSFAVDEPWAPTQPEPEAWAPTQPEPEAWAPTQPESEVWAPTQPESEAWAPTQPETDADEWAPSQPTAPAPVADSAVSAPAEFAAFGGFSGWPADGASTGTTSEYTPQFRSDFAPIGFAPMLDEARAWNAGQGTLEPTAASSQDVQRVAFETPAAPDVDGPEPEVVAELTTGWPEPASTETEFRVSEQADDEWLTPEVEAQWQSTAASVPSGSTWDVPLLVADEPDASWSEPAPTPYVPDVAQPFAATDGAPRPVRNPFFVDSSSQTEMFTPIEAELRSASEAAGPVSAPQAPAPQAPAPQAAAPQAPAPLAAPWMSASAPTAPAAPRAFTELVHGSPEPGTDKGRKRWGMFGRKKAESTPPTVAPAPAVERSPFAQSFEPTSEIPHDTIPRSSAWSLDSAALPLPVLPPRPRLAAPSAPVEQPAPMDPLPVRPAQRPPSQWAPPPQPVGPVGAATNGAQELSSFFRTNSAPRTSTPHAAPVERAFPGTPPAASPFGSAPVVPRPSTAPRVGALDDEVAAMLALRSDIQEQALSELSQLSAYRPAAVNGSTRSSLTRRVPSTIPDALPIAEAEGDRAGDRDPDQLRSRLSSFQSGSSRGRRAAVGPTDTPTGSTARVDETLVDTDQSSTPPAPTW